MVNKDEYNIICPPVSARFRAHSRTQLYRTKGLCARYNRTHPRTSQLNWLEQDDRNAGFTLRVHPYRSVNPA